MGRGSALKTPPHLGHFPILPRTRSATANACWQLGHWTGMDIARRPPAPPVETSEATCSILAQGRSRNNERPFSRHRLTAWSDYSLLFNSADFSADEPFCDALGEPCAVGLARRCKSTVKKE
jgi:hypothetical protein